MDTTIDFFKKWGILLTVFFSLCAAYNSCGTTGKIQKLNKDILSLKSELNERDSITAISNRIQREISENQIAYRVVYDNNTIVRTTARPDDIMNTYITNIRQLQNDLRKLNNDRK